MQKLYLVCWGTIAALLINSTATGQESTDPYFSGGASGSPVKKTSGMLSPVSPTFPLKTDSPANGSVGPKISDPAANSPPRKMLQPLESTDQPSRGGSFTGGSSATNQSPASAPSRGETFEIPKLNRPPQNSVTRNMTGLPESKQNLLHLGGNKEVEVVEENSPDKYLPPQPESRKPTYVIPERKIEPILKVELLPERTEPAQYMGESFEPGRVMAIVGGEPILAAEMMFEARQLVEKFAPNAPEAIKVEQANNLVSRLLPKYVDAKLLYVDIVQGLPEGAKIDQIFESLGTHFDENALEKFITASGVTTAAEFDTKLRDQHSSLRQFRMKWIKDEFVKYFLSQKIKQKHEVTHQEMLDYYRENSEQFAFEAKAEWEQVMVRFDKVDDRAAARKLIVEMGNEVVYGARFEAVAEKSSQGYKASKGGQQDWITKGSLAIKELDEAIFSIPVGKLSDVIETDQGYHIIRVKQRIDAGHKPFREAQLEISAKLMEKKRQDDFMQHIAKLRKRIPVEILADETRVASGATPEIR